MIALVCLALFVVLRVWDPLPLQIFRLKTFDFYQQLKPRERAQLPVVIVDLDEKSLAELGQWPWPRSQVAKLLLEIGKAGGIAVGFDIVFAEPDRLSPKALSQSIKGLGPEARDQLGRLPGTDEQLAKMMRRMRVVLGQTASARQEKNERPPQKQTPVATLGGDPKPYLLTYPAVLRNIEVLEDAAAGKGFFSINPDIDNIVRRVGLAAVAGDTIQPALSVELLRVATGQNAFAIKSDDAGIKGIVVGGVEVPTDRNGRVWIHYTPHEPARFVSASDLIQGRADPARIQNHLVLIGTSATGLLDLKATPLDPAMPGVEIHAQILESILGKSHLVRPNYALGAELVTAALVSLFVITLVPILGAIPVLLFGLLLSGAVVGTGWYLFSAQQILLDVVYPLVTSFAVFLILVFVNYRREEVRRQEIRSAFGQYLAPAYVEQIAENPESLALGGETRTMTFLFSDVRGFTSISESFKGNPQGLTALMNRFLTPLSDAIMGRKGTIDKYMGDAVMAFWNAPLDDQEHQTNACLAALDMMVRLEEVNDERRKEAEADRLPFVSLDVGIGINTGECVVGNMGSEFRFDYSVLGDPVNLASRLEGQSKTYGVPIILGNDTAAAVEDRLAVIEIDLIKVKGKDEPERIFALLGGAAVKNSDSFRKTREHFATMLQLYRSQEWERATGMLTALEGSGFAHPGLVSLYRGRVAEFKASPPGPDWDGVFVATSK